MLTAVRAFYLDIAEWADEDPARWATARGALPGQRQPTPRTRKTAPTASPGWTSGPANGCRCCPPWPHRADAEQKRPPPGCRPPGALRRARVHRRRADTAPGSDEDRDDRPDRAEDPATGKRRDLTFEEHRGFWSWADGRGAAAHRHPDRGTDRTVSPQPRSSTGCRPPASSIPLLQIAPSKTDAERLLVIT